MIATHTFPNLLISATNEDGFMTCTVREGGPRQVEQTTTFDEPDGEPDAPEIFRMKATNEVNIGGRTITVLNDANETLGLPASNPSLTEYRALIGTPVVIAFRAFRQPSGKWKSSKTTILLQ